MNITLDTRQFDNYMNDVVNKQLPFAIAKSLTDTAKDVQRAVNSQIPSKLDRPTRFTMNAVGISRATKRNQTAIIFIKDIQTEYLKYAVEGGDRQPVGSAHALPANTRLNKHGNIAGRRGGKKFDKMLAKPNTFKATIKGVHGIWQRTNKNKKIKLLIAFRKTAHYDKRFPFYKIVEGVARSKLKKNFNKALIHAMATAH